MSVQVNIGQARLSGLEKDLKLHGNQYDIALTVFFVSYVFFEVPSKYVIYIFLFLIASTYIDQRDTLALRCDGSNRIGNLPPHFKLIKPPSIEYCSADGYALSWYHGAS